MKLGLGTVQFGMRYGIANQAGEPALDEISSVLRLAAKHGIHTVDTAALYGHAEETLGKIMPTGHSFEITTKTAKFQKTSISQDDVDMLEKTFLRSLERLRQSQVYGLLFHHAQDLFSKNGEQLMAKALELKRQGLVRKVGVSIDGGSEQVDAFLKTYPLDLMQAPVNILDQRLLQAGHLGRLRSKGVEIHARSVFLQGLLLMEPDQIPKTTPPFERVKPHLKTLRDHLSKTGLSPLEAALGFVLGLQEVDRVIVGVQTASQFKELVETAGKATQRSFDFRSFSWDDEMILNPARW